jgi:hypothetical protein
MHTYPFITHEQIADPQHEYAGPLPGRGNACHWRRFSTNFHPPTIELVTPRASM